MKARIATALLALLTAVPVSAGELDFILGDVEKFEQDLEWQIDAEVQAIEDDKFQETDELFLLVDEDEMDTDDAEIRQQEPFVSVTIDGIPVTFNDVPSDSWFGPYVRSSAEADIVSGYRDENGRLRGLFGPGDNVTLEQLAKMAVQAAGISYIECAGVPKNETVSDWSINYISCAEMLDWVVYSDGSVNLQRPATRSEVVVTIVQAFRIDFTRGSGDVFTDVTASTEFSGPIEMSAAAGVVEGYKDENGELTGLFGPSDPVNRAEVAKIITLAKQIYGGN